MNDETTILDQFPREAWANEYHGYGMILVFFESKLEAAFDFGENSRSNKDKCCILFREVLDGR